MLYFISKQKFFIKLRNNVLYTRYRYSERIFHQLVRVQFWIQFVYSILEKILGKVLVRGVGYFLYELHVLVGADPSGTTTVWAEEESRLLFSFATLLVPCFWLGISVLGVSLSKRSTTSFGWFSKVLPWYMCCFFSLPTIFYCTYTVHYFVAL